MRLAAAACVFRGHAGEQFGSNLEGFGGIWEGFGNNLEGFGSNLGAGRTVQVVVGPHGMSKDIMYPDM